MDTPGINRHVAARFQEIAALLEQQGGNTFRVRAYRQAADRLLLLQRPVDAIFREEGEAGVQTALQVGERLASAIAQLVMTGDLSLIHRLRRATGASDLLESVPGVGPRLARRLHEDLGVESLEDLEAAALDGRLAHVAGFGAKRLAGVRDSLASRLARVRPATSAPPPHDGSPGVDELLDVDREYRESAAQGLLRRIAPRRFNPRHEAWLPVLRTRRGERAYTALYSNTARANQLGRTRDWVVLYLENGATPQRWTVVTAQRGAWHGLRVVRGRELECAAYYRTARAPATAAASSAAAATSRL